MTLPRILPRTPEGALRLANAIEDGRLPGPKCERTRMEVVDGLHDRAADMMMAGSAA
ncbi:MAG: hypothetical protein WBF53_11960 [Litorimonas sp.]